MKKIVSISPKFRDIVKRQRYEKEVLSIIQRSAVLFKGRCFSYVEKQSNGECDFIDNSNRKYDVKLLIDTQQGTLIGEKKNDLLDWIRTMIDECCEYSQIVLLRDKSAVQGTKLYNVMQQRIQSVKNDENAILFCPYPIVEDIRGAIFVQFNTDFLQAVYDLLRDKGYVCCQSVYFLYPSMEESVYVLRNAETRVREYLDAPELSEYIKYTSDI